MAAMILVCAFLRLGLDSHWHSPVRETCFLPSFLFASSFRIFSLRLSSSYSVTLSSVSWNKSRLFGPTHWYSLSSRPGMRYRASSRELKRLDSMLRSLLYAHFSESLAGLPIIRAYNESARFRKENAGYMDLQNRAYILTSVNQRWLSIRVDCCELQWTCTVASPSLQWLRYIILCLQ